MRSFCLLVFYKCQLLKALLYFSAFCVAISVLDLNENVFGINYCECSAVSGTELSLTNKTIPHCSSCAFTNESQLLAKCILAQLIINPTFYLANNEFSLPYQKAKLVLMCIKL